MTALETSVSAEQAADVTRPLAEAARAAARFVWDEEDHGEGLTNEEGPIDPFDPVFGSVAV